MDPIQRKCQNCMKKTCEICDGTGQVSYFKGVSRFLLSWEDCPECNGSGIQVVADEVADSGDREEQISSKPEDSSE